MGLSNYLPWQLSVLLLTLSCIVCILYSVKYWRSGYKIIAVSFFGFSILAAQMVWGYFRGSGYNGDFITRGFKIESGLVYISMLIGAVWKIKREDKRKYKDTLKFLIVIGIILIILQIMVFISLR